MTNQTSESNEILSYVLQRRTLITKACEVFEVLGLPLDPVPDEPEPALRSLAYTWAVTVHPDLMRWYRDAVQTVQSRCIHLRMDQEVEAAERIERLVQRDLKLFTMVIDAHGELPVEMQKRIIEMAPPRSLISNECTVDSAPGCSHVVRAIRGPTRDGHVLVSMQDKPRR